MLSCLLLKVIYLYLLLTGLGLKLSKYWTFYFYTFLFLFFFFLANTFDIFKTIYMEYIFIHFLDSLNSLSICCFTYVLYMHFLLSHSFMYWTQPSEWDTLLFAFQLFLLFINFILILLIYLYHLTLIHYLGS